MRAWPTAHKNVGAVFLLALIGCIVCYFFLIRPKAEEVQDMRGRIEDLQKKLRDSGWTLNAQNLQLILDENTKKLKGTKQGEKGYLGLEDRARELVEKATSPFLQHIEDNYTTVDTFMSQAGWLDYQSDFNNLEQWLRGNDVIISEKTFGISQDTADIETYQLLLHIWTVRELVQIALEHDLVLAKDRSNPVPTPEGRAVLPAMLRVLPVRSYILSTEDSAPYLLEFPVRMSLRGTLSDFQAFVMNLQKEGRFFPITRMELFTENPSVRGQKPNADGLIRVQNIEVTVVCSSFFRPTSAAPEIKLKKEIQIPRGA